MRLLVTGRNGQLVRSLIERSSQVDQLELVIAGRPEFDLASPGSAEQAILAARPDLIINAAAYTAVDRAEDEPELAFRINADAAGEIARAAAAVGARLIQLSTDYVFDGQDDDPYAEDAPTRPLGVYGRSKLAGEEQVRTANPAHLILRTSWVYSPFAANFVMTMIGAAAARDELTVVDDQYGRPTSALDLADGILAIVEDWRNGGSTGLGHTYHLAGTGVTSWYGFAQAIMDECRRQGLRAAEVRPISSDEWPTKAARPRSSVLDSSKFEHDFGFRSPAWQRSLPPVIERIAADLR